MDSDMCCMGWRVRCGTQQCVATLTGWVTYVCTAGVVGVGSLSLQDGDLSPNKKSKPSALTVVNTRSPQKQTRSKTEEVAEVHTYICISLCACVHVCMCACLCGYMYAHTVVPICSASHMWSSPCRMRMTPLLRQ